MEENDIDTFCLEEEEEALVGGSRA